MIDFNLYFLFGSEKLLFLFNILIFISQYGSEKLWFLFNPRMDVRFFFFFFFCINNKWRGEKARLQKSIDL